MRVGGLDPGKLGVVVALSTTADEGFFWKMRYDKAGQLDVAALHRFLELTRLNVLVLERVKSIHGSHASATFSFGHAVGEAGAIARLWAQPAGCAMHLATPQGWQNVMHAGTSPKLDAKERSQLAYARLFPHAPVPRGPMGGKPDENVIDALLLATFGVLRFAGGVLRPWTLTRWSNDDARDSDTP